MKFSIFLPTFNRHASLTSTLRSINAQSHDNYEVFIVDRGSEPSVLDIVCSFNNERFVYIQSSQSVDINDDAEDVINQISSGLFLFLADDDVILPNTFSIISRLAEKFNDIEYFSGGYATYNYADSKLSIPMDFSGRLKSYHALSMCYGCFNSWGIGIKRKYTMPPQCHSSVSFLKNSLIKKTRGKQRQLFIKSFGDIGYTGAMANTKNFLHLDLPIGLVGAGHARATDGIRDRFMHERELVHMEHVPNKQVSCFDNIGLDGHLKVLIRNDLQNDFPPYLRPKAHSKQLRQILSDRPFTLRSVRDAVKVSKSWMLSVLKYLPMRIKTKPKIEEQCNIIELDAYQPISACDLGSFDSIYAAAEEVQRHFILKNNFSE